MDTHCKLKKIRSNEEKDKLIGEEEEEATKYILYFGFLSPFDIVLSDESIQKKLLGFLPLGFPR